AGELPRLDLLENLLHLLLGLFGDDPRAARVVAELRGVANAVPHVVQAALIEQVDDQLQLVHALEVRHFGLISGLDERLVAGLYQLADAAAQHHLLAEQVGLGLLSNRRLDHAAARATNAFGIGQADLERLLRGARPRRDQAGDAAPLLK